MRNGRFKHTHTLAQKYLALYAVSLVVIPAVAASASSGHAADDIAIRAQAADYVQAFANASVDKLAALWEESAVFVDQEGNVFHGRDQIKKQYADFFAENGGQPMDISIESIEFPADDVAVEQGTTHLKNSSSANATTRYLATHVRHDGKWLIESVSESRFKAASNGEYLKPLNWLLGSWKAEGPKGAVKAKAEWVNNNVMSLTVEAIPQGKSKLVHSEFIYWNPRTERISSWQFDADGGISQKWWQKDGNAWIIHASSMQADGSDSRADYLMKPVDNDTYIWQSKRRNCAGVNLPDTEQVKVTRVKS